MRYNLSRDFWQNEPKLGHRGADQAFSISVDGFFEWKVIKGRPKQPYAIAMKD